MTKKLCGACRHFTQDECDAHIGHCDLTLDYNDYCNSSDVSSSPNDRVFGWDYEGYTAGAYVGNKFGCIHWEAVNAA